MQISSCQILTGFILALLMSGCQTNTVRPPETVPTIDISDPRAKLVIGSEKLLSKIGLGDTRFRQVGQLSQAQVLVQNLTDDRYTLEYKFDWESDRGFSAGGINTWHRFTLTPRETKTFLSTGKVPEATNIVFTVRLPDDAFIDNYRRQDSSN